MQIDMLVLDLLDLSCPVDIGGENPSPSGKLYETYPDVSSDSSSFKPSCGSLSISTDASIQLLNLFCYLS